MRSVAEKVMEALHQIPALLSGAQRVLKIYKDSERLKVLSKAFYCSILAALGHILNYLRRKSLWKLLQAGFQQASFERELFEKIDEVMKDRDAFNDEANICQREVLDRLTSVAEKNSEDARKEARILRDILVISIREQTRVHQTIQETLELVQQIKRRQSELGQQIGQKLDAITKIVSSGPLNLMMKMFEENPNVLEFASSMSEGSLRSFALTHHADGWP